MTQNQEIIFDSRYGQLTPEVEAKILKSREEVKNLQCRELKCPVCGFRLEEIYEISSGYVHVKCQKCKLQEPLNLAYFRRIKNRTRLINPFHIGKVKYKKADNYDNTRSQTEQKRIFLFAAVSRRTGKYDRPIY